MTDQGELAQLRREVEELRRNHSRGKLTVYLMGVVMLFGIAVETGVHARIAYAAPEPVATLLGPDSVLRVRGLVVTDARGIERVVIGAPVPNPMYLGKRGKRDGAVSGILMFDAMGTERNGYGTSDESDAMIFTMDNIAGQSALFLANPGTGTHLSTWDTKGNFVRIGVYDRPMLYIERDGRRLFTAPDSVGGTP